MVIPRSVRRARRDRRFLKSRLTYKARELEIEQLERKLDLLKEIKKLKG